MATKRPLCLYSGEIGELQSGDTVYDQAKIDTLDPTGFLNTDYIDISYNSTNRTITLSLIAPATKIEYYWRGVKKELPLTTGSWTSSAHTATAGKWYLSTTNGTDFTWSQTVWAFSDLMVAAINYGATHKFGLRDAHGTMPWQDHEEFHDKIGTYLKSGGAVTANTYVYANATTENVTPGFDAAIIKDEDFQTTISAWPQAVYTSNTYVSGTYTLLFPTVSAPATMQFCTTSQLPFLVAYTSGTNTNGTSANSFIQYINSAGTLTTAANGNFLNVYQVLIPVTSDTGSQSYRMVMLQPQAVYTTLAAAQAEDPRGLYYGDLAAQSAEYVIFARITYQLATGNTNHGKCTIPTNGISYVLGTRSNAVSVTGFTAPTAENTTYTPTIPDTSANVQAALDNRVLGTRETTTVGASAVFAEATNNGTNKTILKGTDSLASDITITLPSTTGTLVTLTGTETLLNKTLTATGQIHANAGTASTSTTTGALIVTGGAGISGALNVGGAVSTGVITSTVTSGLNLVLSKPSGAALSLSGTSTGSAIISAQYSANTGLDFYDSNSTMALQMNMSGTASTSTTSGTLVVTGGAGISGALNVGGAVSTGAVNVSGAVNVGGALNVGGAVKSGGASSMQMGWSDGGGGLGFLQAHNGSVFLKSCVYGSTVEIGTASDASVKHTFSSTGLSVTGDISVSTKTPASATAAGVTGTITWDASYIYVCTATNTWKRVAIATW